MNTATCADCDHGWRGNDAHQSGTGRKGDI